MSQYKYSATVNEHRAKAVGLLSPISAKQGVEICNFIRGKDTQKAKDILNEVIDMKKPIPFKRFTEGAGHKHGIGPGKYPVKACKEILKLIKLVEANAQHNGLDTSSLVIVHICAKKGPKSWHYGRQSRIAMKRTHVEIVVEEKEIKKKEVKKETKKPAKEEESKPIKKQEEKKEPEKEIEEREIKEKQKEEVKEKNGEKIKEEVEIKKQEKPETNGVKEKSKEELKEKEHKKVEAKVKEIREKIQQEEKLQKEKVPTALELAKKKENKKIDKK